MKLIRSSEKIYGLVKKIPKGKITTYKEIANALGTRAYQAVGSILANNPHAFLGGGDVPCHRVVPSDGTIGGYNGKRIGDAVCKKKRLLESEGIRFDGDKIADFETHMFFY